MLCLFQPIMLMHDLTKQVKGNRVSKGKRRALRQQKVSLFLLFTSPQGSFTLATKKRAWNMLTTAWSYHKTPTEMTSWDVREEWSIQYIFQFKQLKRRSLKKIRASMGFQPVNSAIPVRCSTNWAMKPHIGSVVNLLSSYFPGGVKWCEVYMK